MVCSTVLAACSVAKGRLPLTKHKVTNTANVAAPTQDILLHLKLIVQDTHTGLDDNLLEGEVENFAEFNALLAILYLPTC